MSTGKCPKCQSQLTNVNLEEMPIHVNFRPAFRGISLLCPYCQTILYVSIDPMLLRDDILEEISQLRKKIK